MTSPIKSKEPVIPDKQNSGHCRGETAVSGILFVREKKDGFGVL